MKLCNKLNENISKNKILATFKNGGDNS